MDNLLTGLLILISTNLPPTSLPSSSSEPAVSEVLDASQPVKTISKFEEKIEKEQQTILRQVVYKDDPEKELGEEEILDQGADGQITKTIKITLYEGEEYSREAVSTQKEEPKDKIILRGTKIVWRTLDTDSGQVKYWRKIHVWATHYDSHCPGCDEWTAIGLHAGKGVIAVDPKVIKLGTRVYVPGYGSATAGDTGGSIKGNIIDLGFDDVRTAGWSARFIDIYLL